MHISNELGLHKNSFDFMKSSHKYLKNASVLKSLNGGLNDTKSQYNVLMRSSLTDRYGKHESTKGAINFVMQDKNKNTE